MKSFLKQEKKDDPDEVQFLTDRCISLEREKEKLEKECLEAKERERHVRNELHEMSVQLRLQEKLNWELQEKHQQLILEIQHEKEMANLIQMQMEKLLLEYSEDDEILRQDLRNVLFDLEMLRDTEFQLEALTEDLHLQNLLQAQQTERIHTEFSRTSHELDELKKLHKYAVHELQKENQENLDKLQSSTAQLERFCQQQKNWIFSMHRFKASMAEEKHALLSKIKLMEGELAQLQQQTSIQHQGCSNLLSAADVRCSDKYGSGTLTKSTSLFCDTL